MCGIAGLVSFGGPPVDPTLLERMAATLRHRGPDGQGQLCEPRAALGANRLRIVDPGPAADQPFSDPSGLVWLVCNGEIYNAGAIRQRYSRYGYRSGSDVEPILPLFLSTGPRGLAELDGMFGLAIWDGRDGSLVLARDRAGEKPLFVAQRAGGLAFASEIQALLALPDVARDCDARALGDLVALGYIREPVTPFRAVRRVAAGTIEVLSGNRRDVVRYWAPETVPVAPRSASGAENDLAVLLEGAVAKQLRADVPVGLFASGGVDSALLAALARVPLYSVGFDVPAYDETEHAADLARTLGLEHVCVRVGEPELAEAFTAVTTDIAEPVADPAALPTWILARAAVDRVRVVLSGEGADELFGGYPTYLGHRLAPYYGRLPSWIRAALRWCVIRRPPSARAVSIEYLLKRFVDGAEADWPERHARWFGAGGSVHRVPFAVDRRWATDLDDATTVNGERSTENVLRSAMLLDYVTYLRDGLLVKIDRTTMRHALEARAPYLDTAVTGFALGLPTPLRVRGLTTKWLLKRVAARYLPRRLVHRRKRGLSVPIAQWINGGLMSEVDRLLAPERLRRWNAVDEVAVGRLLSEHRAGKANHARALWPIIVWERWAEEWV